MIIANFSSLKTGNKYSNSELVDATVIFNLSKCAED